VIVWTQCPQLMFGTEYVAVDMIPPTLPRHPPLEAPRRTPSE
jgi:hypothetical protein